jgi:hypothetical protein
MKLSDSLVLLVICVPPRLARFQHHGNGYGIPKGVSHRVGAQGWKGGRDSHLLQHLDRLFCPAKSAVHSGCLSAPKGVKIDLCDASHQQGIPVTWVAMLEIPKNTKVALEGC